MTVEKRELYSSPNGDRWFLCRNRASGNVFIRYEANPPSGGQLTDLGIGAYLSRGELDPEHQALLHLIGTLLGSPLASQDRKQHRRKLTGSPGSSIGLTRPLSPEAIPACLLRAYAPDVYVRSTVEPAAWIGSSLASPRKEPPHPASSSIEQITASRSLFTSPSSLLHDLRARAGTLP
jgi:hypothetical protein